MNMTIPAKPQNFVGISRKQRIPFRDFSTLNAEDRGIGETKVNGEEINLFKVLMQHPKLARSWAPFANYIIYEQTLPAREREILILRIGWLNQAQYEWEQHVLMGKNAGLTDDVRSRHQEMFLDEQVDIAVATVAFGMGIDRSNVRFVVHAGAPRSLEHYQQESGRAGRDGLEAECLLIYSAADFLKWRMMLERNGELTDARRLLLSCTLLQSPAGVQQAERARL